VRFEFKSRIVLFCFSFIFVSLENHGCLSHGMQVAGAAWHAVMRTVAGVGDLVQRTGMIAQVGYLVAGRSRGRMTPCVVCIVRVETRSAGFLAEPQNQSRRFVRGLATKPLERFSPVLPQNR
jgi:hypothetical protein